jgi:thiamine biosynthesis lipoprotein
MSGSGAPVAQAVPEARTVPPLPAVFRFSTRAMGSPLRTTILAGRPSAAREAWTAIVADVAITEGELSRFRAASALSRLNRTAGDGAWHPTSCRLYAMLAASHRAWRRTEGRFDPRIIGSLEALGEHAGVELAAGDPARGAGGADAAWLERAPRRGEARLAAPVDSGGIGKGLALRWALQAARRGLDAASPHAGPARPGLLIEAGGDVIVDGPSPDGPAWRIGIEDPSGGEPLAVIGLRNASVATSSTSVRRWRAPDGRDVHHLIDPRTGEPGGGGLVAVSVATADPAWAEVWTKALFLAGPRRIGPEARARGLAAWWVGADGVLEMTPAARLLTVWERPAPRTMPG